MRRLTRPVEEKGGKPLRFVSHGETGIETSPTRHGHHPSSLTRTLDKMPTPRKFAIVLSVGGTPWAIILLMYVVGISIHSGDSSARFAWIFLPGFASYTFWLSRAFNMWFGRWRHVAWLGAAVVNIGYLLVMFPVDELRWNDTSGVVARTWLLFAATLSVFGFACDRKSKPTVSNESLSGEKRVPEAELKKLIDEHRKAESNKSS